MMVIKINIPVMALCHEIEGGGYWAEIREFPGCVAQAKSLADLKTNITQAITDWLQEAAEKTEDEARQLSEIQGESFAPGEPYPQPYPYLPPSDWAEEDE